MRVFVTGASGWIGSAVIPELISAGHQVVGLARSDAAAATVTTAGAEVQRGSLEDLDVLRDAAAASDGIVHLGFIHDFSQYVNSVDVDLRAVETMGQALEGSDRPFLIASGVPRLPLGEVGTEATVFDSSFPRAAAADLTIALAEKGVRSSVLRLPPSVHGQGDHGFVSTIIGIAREKGVSGYIGDGANRWSAVHRLDAAHLTRLALDKAPAGSVLHVVGDEAVPTRSIAEVIGRHLDIPVVSVDPDQAVEHFGWMGLFFAHNAAASAATTMELLDWHPAHLGLIEDLEKGHYFEATRS